MFSPSAARNRAAIVDAFGSLMPTGGVVLEVASGTGEHGAALCSAYPSLRWLPSEPDEGSRASVAAWAESVPDGCMAAPSDLDVTVPGWWRDVSEVPDGVFCANMIHIALFSACEGLFRGTAALLRPGGRLMLYGPFSRRGVMAESNRRFDASLKARDPGWGVRDLDDALQPLGASLGLHLAEICEMPANNLSVVFEKG
nr:DUF938 domain-containing protein [Parvularcula dongshanensis]